MNCRKLYIRNARLFFGSLAVLSLAVVPSGRAQTVLTSAQSQAGQSQHLQLDGELQILQKDFKDKPSVSYSLKLPNGSKVPLRFAKDPPTHFQTGDYVAADGQLVDGNLVLFSGSTNLTSKKTSNSGSTTSTSTGPLPNTFGAQYTLVILVNFQDDAVEPYTLADAQAMYSGPVNDFFVESSYGQTSIAPTVVGWYTIPDSVTTCNLTQIATDAQNAAAAAGTNLSNYTRYVFEFPQNNSCGFAGSSYIGGNPSQSWVNGSTLSLHTIDHELGHALGLWHSHLFDCGTTATIGSNCTVDEYGDILDTMGAVYPTSAHYNAFQKERLGWLNYGASPTIQTVQASGTYTISPYEVDSPGPNALKVLKSTDPITGAKTWYYLEARQAVGFDSFLSTYAGCEPCYTQNETTGALFHTGTDGDGNTGDLLDMTPATQTYYGWFDPSLAVGQSFRDSAAGVTFSPTAVSSTGATIQITMSSAPAQGALTVGLVTNQPSYLPGQTVTLTITAQSGTSPAAGVGFTVTVTPPKGGKTTLTGTTGNNGVASFSYKLSKSAATGTYQAQANTSTTVAGASSTAGVSTTFIVQ